MRGNRRERGLPPDEDSSDFPSPYELLNDQKAWANVNNPTGGDSTEETDPGSADRLPFAVWVLIEAALAPFSLVLGVALGQNPLADFGWDGGAVVLGLIAAVPMIAAAFWMPSGPMRRIRAYLRRELAPVLRGCEWPDLALISVAAGVGEEMLFRGVIQGTMTRSIGPLASVLAAGAVFGLLHAVSTDYVVIAGLLGVYLGFVWLETGNLLTVIVAHAVYDFVGLTTILRDLRDPPDAPGD